jgi:WD40 repeat protein/DNA-binding SARP family transcriptional activator
MAERLVLRLLGTFEAEADEQPVTHFEAASARALLAYLATHRRSPQMRSQLAALLWGLDVGHTGLTNLRSALRRVRNAVDSGRAGPSCLLTDREMVQLHPDLAVEVDTEQFEALLLSAQSHSHPSEYDCPTCIECYRQAVNLYRGLFLADLTIETEPFEQWRTALQDRYRRHVLHTLYILTEHEFRLGSLTAAETFARRQLEIEHWNEESHRQLMRVLLTSGRRSAALAQYEACRQALAAELGAVPSEETDALYARIVAGVAPPAAVQLYNPYKGLQPFAIDDSLYFFGQEVMTGRLLAAVQEQSFVALIGASGSGKSSVIHAGLAASLASPLSRQQDSGGDVWCIASMRPGVTPLAALADSLLDCGYMPPSHSSLSELLHHDELTLNAVAAALPSLNQAGKGENRARRLLLIVDQFEEIFTLCHDSQARNSFMRFLLNTGKGSVPGRPSAVVVLSMRADFLGGALQHRGLADALQEHTLLLGPMVRSELQRAIEEPARLQGAALEPGLVDRILGDIGTEPGRLPLLQFALALLWLRQQDGWLTHATYDEIGGLRGALTDYADDVYLHLSLPEQQAARRVFLGLVEPGFDAQDIRHLATRAEIGDSYWPVVQRLADARLVVTNTNVEGEETVELAHEALIREWRRLHEWLAADQEFRRWQQQARIAAEHWRQNGEDESTLLYGVRLAEAERWVNDRQADITPLLHRYVASGAALREQKRLEEISRQERELQQVQAAAAADRRRLEVEQVSRLRLRRLTSVVAIATCVAIVAALAAWQAQRRAEDNARVAHSRQMIAQAVSVMHSDPDLALLLSLESLRLDGSPQSRTTLFRELEIDARLQRILYGESSALHSLGIQNEDQVLASNEQGAIIAWDLASGAQRNVLDSDDEIAHAAAVSPTGDRFVTTQGGVASLWDSATFATVSQLQQHMGDVSGVSFTYDGQRLVTIGKDGLVLLWDAQDGKFLQQLLSNNERQVYGPVSIDGTVLLMGDSSEGEDALDIWDTIKNRRVGTPLIGHTDAVHGYSVSPDGLTFATASFDGSARLWDIATGEPVGEPFLGHAGRVLFAAFSPDGRTLATGATDSKVLLWDVPTHTQLGGPLIGHSNWVRVGEFSDDGQTLATGDDNGHVLLWDLSREQWLLGHTDRVRSVAVSPDQQTLVTSGFDKRLIVWDAAALTQRQDIATPHEHAIISVEFSPDGKTLVSVDAGGHILFWDVATWQPRYPLQHVSPETVLIDLAFSRDGAMLATGAFDGIARLWNPHTGELLPDPIQAYTTGWALSVALDPTGNLLATGGADGAIKLWDVATRRLVGEPLVGHSNRVTDLVFSPDGKILASSSADSTIRYWKVDDGTPLDGPLTSGSQQVWTILPEPQNFDHITALGGDGSIAWWNVAQDELLRPLLMTHLETEEMKGLADGSRFFLGSTGLLALAVMPAPGDWEQTACEIANRSLTEEEWDKYMNGAPYDPVCK